MKFLKTMKKLLSVTLCAALIGGAAITVPAVVQDSAIIADALTYGDYEYDVSNNAVTITKYKGSASSVSIPSSIDGKTVTSIGDDAFNYCSSLTSITIPDSVTSIGWSAFRDCANLTNITIPDSVTSIGYSAFSDCTSLKGITIPDSVTSIGDDAFYDCTSLASVTIGNSVTSIGYSAFSYCTGLTSVTIGNSVKSIGKYAFSYCTNLTSITIGDSVTSIGDYAFQNCTSLKGITIPDSVTSIGSRAFSNCTGLTSVILGNGVTSIGDWAFYNCTGLTRVTIGNSVKSIGEYAFSGCTGLKSITIPDSVKSIGDYAFKDCTGLTSITIGNSVTIIGNYAFQDCTSLKSITIPDSVTSIGSFAFYNCTGLTSITIGNSVTSIGDYAFKDCTGLTSIDVDRNNKNYSSSDGVLYDKLQTILLCCPGGKDSCSIPDSVTSIGYEAFYGCTGLKSITIPDSVTSIDWYAFYKCTGLTSVTIGNSVTSIGGYAFSDTAWYNAQANGDVYAGKVYYKYKGDMPDNTSIVIKPGTKGIADRAFYGCSSLTSIAIPDSVTSIGNYAFQDCTSLTSITISDSVTSIGNFAFKDCTSLTSVILGNSVTSIGYEAFYGCTSLTSITIPSSVTSIGWYAFSGCKKLTIYGKSGSYAETYANENGIGFAVLPGFENTSSTSSESLTLGKKLTITGAAENGTAPYTYAYYFKRSANSKWNVIGTEFGTAKSATFKPTAAADYDIKVIVKDAKGKTAEKLFKLTVVKGLTNTSWLNAEKVQIGDDIRVTGGAEGGAGGYKYAFYFKRSANSKWNKIGTEFGTKTYGITIPQAAVGYDMKVIVKDSAGNTAEKIFKVTVVESLPLTNISFLSAYDVPVGKTVTAAGRFVGGARPCTYEFYFKRTANTKWNKLSYGSAAGTYAKFTPTAAASYDIKVIAIDSAGTKASKVMTITAE